MDRNSNFNRELVKMANNNLFGKIEDANKTEFHAVLKNLDQFEEFESKMVSVGGSPWTILFEKTEVSDDKGNAVYYLGIFLISKIKKNANVSTVLAYFKAKLFSKRSVVPRVFSLSPSPYNCMKKKWGNAYCIPWKELMDPEKGYLRDNSCKISIKITASPLQKRGVNSCMIDFVPIKTFRDDSLEGEFRMKINHVHQFSGICSPEFTLGNFQWHFLISKYRNSHEKFLRVELFNSSESSCNISLKCKLISNNPDIEDVVDELKNYRLNRSYDYSFDMISWKELCNPEKNFIQDNSFVIEVKFEIIESKESLKQEANEENEDVKFKCVNCSGNLVGQSTFALACGHILCKACAQRAQHNKLCPKCKANLTGHQLLKLQLNK